MFPIDFSHLINAINLFLVEKDFKEQIICA